MTRWIIKLYSHIAVIMGMTSYRYDAASDTYRQTLGTRIIMLLANVGALVMLPFVLADGVEQMALLQWNPLMVTTNYLNLAVRAVATTYPVLLRYRSEYQLRVIMSAHMQLQDAYLGQLPYSACLEQHFARLLRVKFGCLLLFCSATAVSFLGHKRDWSWGALLFVPFECSVLMITHLVMFHYFLLLWYMCRNMTYVNEELPRLVQQLQQCSSRAMHWRRRQRHRVANLLAALQRAMDAHWQLARMTRRISDVASFQLLLVRFNGIISTVIMCYYSVIFIYGHRVPMPLIAYNLLLLFVMFCDVYLLECIGDIIARSYVDGAHALRGCNELRPSWQHGTPLNVACESFVLRELCWQLRLDACGLFVSDKRFLFDCFAGMLMSVVVLVQFHVNLS